jgi:DNA polymerase-3 subunit chi
MTTTRVTFYDIAPEGRFQLAAKLALAAWDKGKRLLLRCAPEDAVALDQHLWVFREESFLPHEVCDDPERLADPEARVVIVTRDVRPIEADILLQLAPTELAFAEGFDAVIDLVDHRDSQRLDQSRARYKAWVDRGLRPELKKPA